jgi:type I restriction enzyme S subunit
VKAEGRTTNGEWKTVALGDVAEFVRGINFKPDDVVPTGTLGSVACMRTKNVQAELDLSDVWSVGEQFVRREDQFLQAGDVLVSSANSWNLVGKCCWIPELPGRASFGGFVSVLRPHRAKVEPRFLFRWFSSDRIQITLRSFGQQTTNISNLNTDRCLKLPLPLPPLAEQRRIAEVLDRAEALRAKRRATLAQLDSLTQSLFFDLFGDPKSTRPRFPKLPIAELCEIDSPLVDPTKSEYENLQHIGPDRIEGHSGQLLPTKSAKEDGVTSVKFLFEADAILYSKIRPNLNKVALAESGGLCSADVYPLRVKPQTATREFVWRLLLSEDFLSYAAGFSNRANIPKLNREQFMAYPALCPPLPLQQTFARRVAAVERLKASHRAALAHLDALFASLQHRAFRGEL